MVTIDVWRTSLVSRPELKIEHQEKSLFVGFFIVAMTSYGMIFLLEKDALTFFTREDGLAEYVGATALLFASITSFIAYWRTSSPVNTGVSLIWTKAFFLCLALSCFFGFGEEVSWGQRIFGVETPAMLREINVQGETNFHNSGPMVLEGPLVGYVVLGAFHSLYLFVFVFTPALSMISGRISGWLKNHRVPVAPLGFGLWFPMTYGIRKVLQPQYGQAAIEINETLWEILLAVCCYILMRRVSHIKRELEWRQILLKQVALHSRSTADNTEHDEVGEYAPPR